jgi:hypothetical protein
LQNLTRLKIGHFRIHSIHRSQFDRDTAHQANVLLGRKPNLIVCNAAGHEIRRQGGDVAAVYNSLLDELSPDGVLIIGDYWYPPSVNETDVARTMWWIKETTGHTPTSPNLLISPTEVRAVINDANCRILEEHACNASPHIKLEYYVLTACRRDAS